MAENRLAISMRVANADAGLQKLRAIKGEMHDVKDAATDAERGVDQLGDEFDQAGAKANRYGRSLSGASRETDALSRVAGSAVSRLAAIGAASAAAAASLAAVGTVRVGAGFEEQMSAVLAITRSTGDEFDALSEKARELGATTVFSAREAAEGMEFLARAGFNANQIVGALPGTLNLAAAGALDLGQAADIASNVLTGFGLAAEEAGRVSDVLAKAAASSNTNVQQLGEGMKFVAPIAAGLGVSLEETTAAIGKLSDAGLQASVAGTGLRRILSELASPTDDLKALMGDMTLEADGFTEVMKHLATQSISTGEALEIFGDRGGPAFSVLIEAFKNLDEQGVSSVENLAKALDNADGFAEETAKTMTDNLNGAVKQMKSALDELFLTAADDGGALEGLTALVDELTEALRSDAAKEFALAFGQAMRDAAFATSGLINILDDVAAKLKPIVDTLEFIHGISPFGVAQDLRFGGQRDEDGQLIEGTGVRPLNFGDAYGKLVERGEAEAKHAETMRWLEQVKKDQAEQIESIIADRNRLIDEATASLDTLFEEGKTQDGTVTTRFQIVAEQVIAPEFLDEFEKINNFVGELVQKFPAATDAIKDFAGANDNAAGKMSAVEASLREQLAIAEKLHAAAQGGQGQFDAAKAAIELDALAIKAVEQAAKAGEELTVETARFLLEQISGLEKATQAMLDAEKALRERATAKADDIADTLVAEIGGLSDTALRSDLSNKTVIASLEKSFDEFSDYLDEATIGLNVEQLDEVYGAFEESGVAIGQEIKNAADYHAKQIQKSIQFATGDLLDDLIFNQGKGIDDIFKNLARDAVNDNFIDPISKALTGEGDIFGNITKSFQKELDGFKEAFGDTVGPVLSSAFAGFQGFKIGQGVSNLLGIEGNPTSVVAGGAIGGAAGLAGGLATGASIGSVVPVIGTAIGAVLGTLLGGLFSKPSRAGASATINETGNITTGFEQNPGVDANLDILNAITDAASQASKAIQELTGATPGNDPLTGQTNEAVLSFNVDNRDIRVGYADPGFSTSARAGQDAILERSEAGAEQAVTEGIKFLLDSLKGGNQTLVEFASSALDAGRSLEDTLNILQVLAQVSDEGVSALTDYALAAANAGRSVEQIISGVNAISNVMSLSEEPLSGVAAGLKSIDDAINPVISDLKSLKQSFDEVAQIGKDAERALGVDFIKDVQDDITRFQNATLAELKSILEEQSQRLADAQLLLARGAITEDEFRLVEQRNALEQTSFFDNLDQDALNDLGDYLGLVRENGGEAAVALLQFNQEMDSTRDKLTTGLAEMREEADRFFAAAQANFNLSDDIRFRLSDETGTTQLATFRSELEGLLIQTRAGDVNAAERAPDVARQFIELAERQFGASAGLGQARDFVTDILDQIGTAATGFGNETLDAITLAEQQVGLLDQIKATLESPDPALDVLQSILTNNEIQNQTLNDLLDQYVQLAYDSPAQNFTPGQVQQAAQIVIPSDLKITNTVSTDAPSTVLAINSAAAQARQDAETTREIMEAQERRMQEMQETIAKLDSTLRRTA